MTVHYTIKPRNSWGPLIVHFIYFVLDVLTQTLYKLEILLYHTPARRRHLDLNKTMILLDLQMLSLVFIQQTELDSSMPS